MAYTVPVEKYVRSPKPALPDSQQKYIHEELKKLETTLGTVSSALAQVENFTGGSWTGDPLTEADLSAGVNGRLDLIDGSGAGSVNARIAAESSARTSAIQAEATARIAADLAESTARQAAISQLTASVGGVSTDIANLSNTLNSTLNQEVTARIAGDNAEAAARSTAIQAEATARANAILAEQNARSAAILTETNSRVQGLANEAAARTTAISQEAAARAQALLDEATARGAAITQEGTVRQNADAALAQQVSTLSATVSTNNSTVTSAIQQETATRVSALAAEASARDTLATQIRGGYSGTDVTQLSTGLIHSERVARTTADSSLQSQITSLSSTVTTTNASLSAAITQEASTRATAISAEAASRESLSTQLRGSYTGTDITQVSTGLIHSERQSRISADENLQSQVNLLVAASSGDFSDLYAVVSAEETARIAGDAALASSVSSLSARLQNVKDANGNPTNKTIEATLVDDRQARISGDDALVSSVQTLGTTVNNNFNTLSSGLQQEATTRASQIESEATSRETLAAQLRGNYEGSDLNEVTTGFLFNERTARATADTAISNSVSALSATVTNNFNSLSASITTEQSVRASADSANASAITNLSSTVNGNTASINTIQSSVDGVKARYSVTIDNNGFVSGFSLLSDNSQTPTSTFKIQADKFIIGSATAPTVTPFVVDGQQIVMNNVSVRMGNNPAISGTGMTGSGAAIDKTGPFALGNSSKNIVFDGDTLNINGFTNATASVGSPTENFLTWDVWRTVHTFNVSKTGNVLIGGSMSNIALANPPNNATTMRWLAECRLLAPNGTVVPNSLTSRTRWMNTLYGAPYGLNTAYFWVGDDLDLGGVYNLTAGSGYQLQVRLASRQDDATIGGGAFNLVGFKAYNFESQV